MNSKTVERFPNDNALLDDMLNAWIITEYEIAGDLMSMPQYFKIMSKYQQHQIAWGFLKLREEQLALGDRITPDMRKQLHREWQACFLGQNDETVRGGPILDRIEMYAFGQRSIPAVFAPSEDAFDAEWIDGTFGLFSWKLRVQHYQQLVRDKKGTFRQEYAGGFYGRLDGEHWTDGQIPDNQPGEINAYKSAEDGGLWAFN